MSKQESSSDDKETTGILATDPDPVQNGDAVTADETESGSKPEAEMKTETETETETKEQTPVEVVEPVPVVAETPPAAPKQRRSWLGLFNFLLILALAGAAGYYWRQQQQLDAAYQADIAALEQQLAQKADKDQLQSSLQSGLNPLKSELGSLESKLNELGLGQQSLRESSETLYELFGRDRNDWRLAEVEYLMRVSQHKLILQDDFEGAAITLQAASDRIGLTGDPGLLPVRVMISEEIAELKTRKRPDLVGMTLILAQLGRQVRALQPGFAVRVDEVMEQPAVEPVTPLPEDWLGRFNAFLDSLISIRKESTRPSEIEANVVDVSEVLEDNLKLARWAVLERDARQYELLLDRSLALFREFYDLDNAANHDFMTQLQDLQKMVIKPEKPDITGSLRELQRILSQRENAPPPTVEPAAAPAQEADNG
jgi:uroporphyrin-3 C-methyltransferase